MKNILLYLALFCFFLPLSAQDFIFSNYSYAGYYINPSLPSLIDKDIRIQTKYRGQWSTVSNVYKTLTASADFNPLSIDTRFCGKKLVISPQIIQDIAGSLKLSTTSLNMNLAYSQFLDRNYRTQIMVGLQAGYSFRSIDLSKAKLGSEYLNGDETIDITDPFLRNKSNYANLAVGGGMAFYPIKKFNCFIGIAAYNLIGQNISFYNGGYIKEYRRLVANFSTNYIINESNDINAYLIFQMQGSHKSYTGGATWGINFGRKQFGEWKNKLFFGGGLRWGDAIITSVGYGNDKFDMTFNYDINYSKLIKASKSVGAFELSLTFQTDWFKADKNCPTPINCATFR